MAYHNILSKNDRAIVAFLVANDAGTNSDTWPAKRSQDKSTPCTIVYSEEADEVATGTSCFACKTSVIVKTDGADDAGETVGTARLASDARTATVFGLLFNAGNTLATEITSAAHALAASDPTNHADLAHYTCDHVQIGAPATEQSFDESGVWTETLNLIVTCRPSADTD